MEKVNRVEEPAVERWSEDKSAAVETKDTGAVVEFPFFRLSGGLMRENAKASNRIDGLLMRMMEHPAYGRYHPNVDKNLDYLFTYLQLDMIGMVANDVSEMSKKRSEVAPPPDPAMDILSGE